MTARSLIAAILALVLATSPTAFAQSRLDRIDDWAEAAGWEGVGLVQIGRGGSCTGALIRPDLVLTAAHCVYDTRGRLHEPASIGFFAAWRDGQAISRRVGSHVLAHPRYKPTKAPDGEAIYNDLALLQLDQAIAGNVATPFAAGRAVGEGDAIWVVSYGAGRNDAPSLERDCEVKTDFDGVFAMNCSIVPGSSGSPVFSIRNGKPQIVSVISALGHDGTAYGMDVSEHLRQLLADFDAGNGVYPARVQGSRRISIGQSQSTGGGAKFVKP